jgi:uncharacterized 2Fe-2S/4Fe-4S cluster protein (DUF4445 family)
LETLPSLRSGQAPYGADVIARIAYANTREGGLAQLQAAVVQTVNQIIDKASAQCGVDQGNVYEALAAGNTTMLHLLLGADPTAIGVSPFIPAFQDGMTLAAADLGLRLHPEARLTTLPHLGAYVGADAVAGLLATQVARNLDGRLRLYIDLGTNSEIVLGSGEQNLCVAAPAGPAFEGAEIRCGMWATQGAIERVEIHDDVQLGIIGRNSRPAGICGSGLVDAVAELLRCGLIDLSGRFVPASTVRDRLPSALVARLIQIDGAPAFLLSSPDGQIVLAQRDVRELQAAKAAIACGTAVLLSRMGRRMENLDEVLLAGAFGSYLRPASARRIGLVPAVALERVLAVGNAAGDGVRIALLSRQEREAARQSLNHIDYIEFSGLPEFNDLFTSQLDFPPLAA